MFHTKSSDGKTDLLTRPWQKQVVNIEQSGSHHNLIYPMSLLFFQCCFGTLKRFLRLADLLALAKNAPDIVTFARKCIVVQIPEPEGQPSIPLGICSCGKCYNGASLREQWMQARQISRAQSSTYNRNIARCLSQVNTNNQLLDLPFCSCSSCCLMLHCVVVQLLQHLPAAVVVLVQLLQLLCG